MTDRKTISFASHNYETQDQFYLRVFGELEEMNYVPIARVINPHQNMMFEIMYCPKDRVDSGAPRDQLIPHCLSLPVPNHLMELASFYTRPSGTTATSETGRTSPQVEIPVKTPESLDTGVPLTPRAADAPTSSNSSFPKLTLTEGHQTLKSHANHHLTTGESNSKPELLKYARRLVFIRADYCMICDKRCIYNENRDNLQMVTLSDRLGWIVCDNCVENGWAKEEVVGAIERDKKVPISFLYDEKYRNKWIFEIGGVDYLVLKFWRKSQQGIYLSFVPFRDHARHTLTANDPSGVPYDNILNVEFIDLEIGTDPTEARNLVITPEFIAEKYQNFNSELKYTRSVSLSNLFYYNPGLYEDFVETPSLFRDYIHLKVRVTDLTTDVQQLLETHKNLADKSDKKFVR